MLYLIPDVVKDLPVDLENQVDSVCGGKEPGPGVVNVGRGIHSPKFGCVWLALHVPVPWQNFGSDSFLLFTFVICGEPTNMPLCTQCP